MRTKVFKSGNSTAIRVPASIKIIGKEVEITDLGVGGILITPVAPKDPWQLFDEGIEELGGVWPERDQGRSQERASW